MDTADQLVKEIFSWITQGENYADKLVQLARKLVSERKGANVVQCVGASTGLVASAIMFGAGAASLLTGGLAILPLALGAAFTGVGAGTCVVASKLEENCTQKILCEARDILDRSNKIITRIQELFEKLKAEKRKLYSALDPEEIDKHIMADVLMAVGRHRGMDMSNFVRLHERLTEFRFTDGALVCGPQLGSPHILMGVCAVLLIFSLNNGGRSMQLLAASGLISLSGGLMLTGAASMAYFLPEAIDRWKDLIKNNHVTEASESLRTSAEVILKITRKLREEFNTIEESLKKLSRIKSIIEKKNRTRDEKDELIDHAIKNTRDPVVQQWLRENAESEVFFQLVSLACFIQDKLNEEASKKEEEEDRKRKKIELVFLAHGEIGNLMIPARCLLPLTSITDVLLYSPWNCLLSTEAAYSIAAGSIEPHHRRFGCTSQTQCSFPPEAHTTLSLPFNWNSMRSAGSHLVPNIMVSRVGEKGDKAFAEFTDLAAHFGAPADNRYLIPYLARDISKVPFFAVMSAISLVLFFSGYEATVHLVACLGRSPKYAIMQEEYLKQQYAYTVDNTGMTVPRETIPSRYAPVFNMFKTVFGDVSPLFNG